MISVLQRNLTEIQSATLLSISFWTKICLLCA